MSDHTPIEFCFNTCHNVRVVIIKGAPWFVATDIANILEYRDAANLTRILDEDEADTHNMSIRSENGVEQSRSVTIISESGLYHAILKSRKPEAKRFRKWITFEVLPEIRKRGSYTFRPLTPLSGSQLCRIRQAVQHASHRDDEQALLTHRICETFGVQDLSVLPQGSFDAVMGLIDQKKRGMNRFYAFYYDITRWFERHVMGGGYGYVMLPPSPPVIIRLFKHHKIRTLRGEEKLWFFVDDIEPLLRLTEEHFTFLKNEDITVFQSNRIVSAIGLFGLIINSESEAAEDFKTWFFDEVIIPFHTNRIRGLSQKQYQSLQTEALSLSPDYTHTERQVYNHLRCVFNVNRIKHIPPERFEEAMAIVQAKKEPARKFYAFRNEIKQWFLEHVWGGCLEFNEERRNRIARKMMQSIPLPQGTPAFAFDDGLIPIQ